MATPAIIDNATWQVWRTAGRSAQLIDVRSATEFASGHLPGAINIPLEQIELRTADLDTTRPIVLVCQAGTRARLAASLLEPFTHNLTVLDPGTGAWIRSGNPAVRSAASRWALERQVRLGAGLLVIAGVALGVSVSLWFLGVAAFIGCGLIFAGATNICPMGEFLARMSWNRTCSQTRPTPRIQASSDADPTPSLGLSWTCDQQKQA